MVFGRCCISLKMKSWREDSYCVEKKIFIGRTFYKWIFQWWEFKVDPLTEAAGSSDTGTRSPVC